jgi:hypothetical protein
MNSVTLVLVIVIVVIVLAVLGMVAMQQMRKRRSEQLKERFGPEYERSVAGSDNKQEAENQLREREKRHKDLELRDLDEGQRRQFDERWSDLQRDFVDDPGGAVRGADRLVVDVMSARGYPVDKFDQRADDLSVRYPSMTQHYREARRIAQANEQGRASTEDLRGAVTNYRSLIGELVHDQDAGGSGDRAGNAAQSRQADGREQHDNSQTQRRENQA